MDGQCMGDRWRLSASKILGQTLSLFSAAIEGLALAMALEALQQSFITGKASLSWSTAKKRPRFLERAVLRMEALSGVVQSRFDGSNAGPQHGMQANFGASVRFSQSRDALEAMAPPLLGFVKRLRRRKKSGLARMILKAGGWFLRTRRRHAVDRRKKVAEAILSLGFRLFLLSQAEKLSMLRALWNDSKGGLESELMGFGGGNRGNGKGLGFSGGNEGGGDFSAPQQQGFMHSFAYICGVLFAVALGFVLLAQPPFSISWMVDWILSLAVVLSVGVLSFWMIRMAALAIFNICRTSSWMFSEMRDSLAAQGLWFKDTVSPNLLSNLLVVACASACALLLKHKDWVSSCLHSARKIVVSIKYKIRSLKYRMPRHRKSKLSSVYGKLRSVFSRA